MREIGICFDDEFYEKLMDKMLFEFSEYHKKDRYKEEVELDKDRHSNFMIRAS